MYRKHELKIQKRYFDEIINGNKSFEVRKNDRDFWIGDLVVLREWENNEYSGREISAEIKHILDDSFIGLQPGYVVFQLEILKATNHGELMVKEHQLKMRSSEAERVIQALTFTIVRKEKIPEDKINMVLAALNTSIKALEKQTQMECHCDEKGCSKCPYRDPNNKENECMNDFIID